LGRTGYVVEHLLDECLPLDVVPATRGSLPTFDVKVNGSAVRHSISSLWRAKRNGAHRCAPFPANWSE
jgi:hypothetical protein